jgi:hypothetical protein
MMSAPPPTEAFQKTVIRGFGPDRVAAEQRLQAAGILIPVTERAEFLRELGHSDAALLILTRPDGAEVLASNISSISSRALPWHRRLRVSRLGGSTNPRADAAMLSWIADHAREDFRCLTLTVELFDRDAIRRGRLATTLHKLGFIRATRHRSYRATLALELDPSADELFAALGRDTRYCVRAPLKHGMVLRTIEDPAYTGRVAAMIRQTFARTGGTAPNLPWRRIIEFSAREPLLSRISAVVDPRLSGPDSLVSFAWGVARGLYVSYEAGATVRRDDLGNMSLSYAAVWDLVSWAKRNSASWFDFGGVTAGLRPTRDDPVGGISAFKRSFCQNVVEVGEEWVLQAHPWRASIADLIGSAARIARPGTRGSW